VPWVRSPGRDGALTRSDLHGRRWERCPIMG